jgi:ubiquinol-cytochrome c reductase iron-sulfur subunit
VRPPREERAPVAVVLPFGLAVVCAVGFAVGYGLDLGTEALGLALGGAFAFTALGLAVWSRRIDAHEPEYVEERAVGPSAADDYTAFQETLTSQPVPRSRVLWSMLGLAVGSIGAAMLFPLRSMYKQEGGSPDRVLTRTPWGEGRPLVDEKGLPVRPEDLEFGSVLTVFPEGIETKNVDAATLLIKVNPDELDLPPDRADWAVDGVVAYSKLCTHAGCPVALYADETRQLLCPCHHSVFDVLRGASPVEGPAARPLPQLPLGTDTDGYLLALGDFSAPVGAGWWRYPE